MSRLLRAMAFLLAAFAAIPSAEASQCRHVDRLVLGENHIGLPSFWADRSVPVWEADTSADVAVQAVSCHDPASGQPFLSAISQPMVESMSSGLVPLNNSVNTVKILAELNLAGLAAPSPEPRPPRA